MPEHRWIGLAVLSRYLAAPSLHLEQCPLPGLPEAPPGSGAPDPGRCFADAVSMVLGRHRRVAVFSTRALRAQGPVAGAAPQCTAAGRGPLVVLAARGVGRRGGRPAPARGPAAGG